MNSQEAVVSEISLHGAIETWLKGNKNFVGSSSIASFFSHVYYELLAPGDDYSGKYLPKTVLTFAMQRSVLACFAARAPGNWDGAILVPS